MIKWISLLLILLIWSNDIHSQALALQKKNGQSVTYYYPGDIIKISLRDKKQFYEIYLDSITPTHLVSYGNRISIDSIKYVAKTQQHFNYAASAGGLISAGVFLPIIVITNSLLNGDRPLLSNNFAYSSAVLIGAGGLLLSLEQKQYTLHKKYHLAVIARPE